MPAAMILYLSQMSLATRRGIPMVLNKLTSEDHKALTGVYAGGALLFFLLGIVIGDFWVLGAMFFAWTCGFIVGAARAFKWADDYERKGASA